jgi:hypothetical protein
MYLTLQESSHVREYCWSSFSKSTADLFLSRSGESRFCLFPEQSMLPTFVRRIVCSSVIPGGACVDARVNTQETARPAVITYQDHMRYEKYFDGSPIITHQQMHYYVFCLF